MILYNVEQNSPEWHALRAGKPTASEFSKLVINGGKVSASLEAYAATLAGELCTGEPLETWSGNRWTERGQELEAEAIQLYEFARDVTTTPVGFIETDDHMAGCSPDRLVGCDGCVEVKCLKGEHHIAAILFNNIGGGCPPEYLQQVQGQLLIAEREWCDVIFFHPKLPSMTVRVLPDPVMQRALSDAIATICDRRDKILAILQAKNLMAERTPAPAPVDLATAKSVF